MSVYTVLLNENNPIYLDYIETLELGYMSLDFSPHSIHSCSYPKAESCHSSGQYNLKLLFKFIISDDKDLSQLKLDIVVNYISKKIYIALFANKPKLNSNVQKVYNTINAALTESYSIETYSNTISIDTVIDEFVSIFRKYTIITNFGEMCRFFSGNSEYHETAIDISGDKARQIHEELVDTLDEITPTSDPINFGSLSQH